MPTLAYELLAMAVPKKHDMAASTTAALALVLPLHCEIF